MLTKEFLEKIGFESDDIEFILTNNAKYAHILAPIVKEYTADLNPEPYVPYAGDNRARSLKRADLFINQMKEALPDENPYLLSLLGWLNCIPYLYELYKKNGLSEELFYEAMKDFSYKAKECKTVYGICGLFVNWFFLFFELKEFSLGRLQYEVYPMGYDYSYKNIQLKRGDRVYSCHIPSSGKLTYDMCMDSFQSAYEFFKTRLMGDIIPIVCCSWLLYKPFVDKVYPENSNIMHFAKLFDHIISDSAGNAFHDGWRVFGKEFDGTTEGLPADTALQRRFIKYINDGGDFGYGYGIILYDGKNKRIINQREEF